MNQRSEWFHSNGGGYVSELGEGEIAYTTPWGIVQISSGEYAILSSWGCMHERRGAFDLKIQRLNGEIVVLSQHVANDQQEAWIIEAIASGKAWMPVRAAK